jgi:diguanylate cyclase (GGDEF)-like protein
VSWATVRVLAIVAALCVAAFGTVVHLQRHAAASSSSQLALERVSNDLQMLATVPFAARPATGGTPASALRNLHIGERRVTSTLDHLRNGSPPAELDPAPAQARKYFGTLHQIYLVGISPAGYGARAEQLSTVSRRQLAAVNRTMSAAARVYAARATAAQNEVLEGSGVVIALLFLAFALFHQLSASARAASERLAAENGHLLYASREEALSDALTGLGNRRAMIADLSAAVDPTHPQPTILVLFDLDGFKAYNDGFGHPAGDALLELLGHRLQRAVAPEGATAYRMGGDEFCILAPADDPGRVVWAAWSALSERGEGFEVGCSYGVAEIPEEAASVEAALRVADRRLYEDKASGRPSGEHQSADMLLALIDERGAGLREHAEGVARLAELTAERLGLSEEEILEAGLAAKLHDVGKDAIPAAVVSKPGSLNPAEQRVIERHTLIGERIIRAAPDLVPVAMLVRSSHERFDGTGYPDGLRGEEIPIGARVLAVCDTYDAMVTDRVYQNRVSPMDALAELRRCAGTQFDPRVVEVFCSLQSDRLGPAGTRAA